MNKSTKNLLGMVFGRLTVIKYNGTKNHMSTWMCYCSCDENETVRKEVIIFAKSLMRGDTKSCGCYRKELASVKTHGMSRTKEYRTWSIIKDRCYNEKSNDYPNYGGRGIKMCDRWVNNFENFYEDMYPRPSLKHSIDREDNNGDYSPENCRWATTKEQRNNTRCNVYLEYNGERLTMAQWSEKLNIKPNTISYRISHGWTVEETLTGQRNIKK